MRGRAGWNVSRDPEVREALEEAEAAEATKTIGWEDLVCGMCPAFERFPFNERCEGGCAHPHESVRGLCRMGLATIDRIDGERGRWPVVNVDDWCVPGRDLMTEALDEEAGGEAGDDPS